MFNPLIIVLLLLAISALSLPGYCTPATGVFVPVVESQQGEHHV